MFYEIDLKETGFTIQHPMELKSNKYIIYRILTVAAFAANKNWPRGQNRLGGRRAHKLKMAAEKI